MLFFKVKNKVTGQISVLTQGAKERIERQSANAAKYEILEECDQSGRPFDYNNFLNKANESKSIGFGKPKEKENHESNGGIHRIEITEPIRIEEIGRNTGDNGTKNTETVDSDTKPKRIKFGKGK